MEKTSMESSLLEATAVLLGEYESLEELSRLQNLVENVFQRRREEIMEGGERTRTEIREEVGANGEELLERIRAVIKKRVHFAGFAPKEELHFPGNDTFKEDVTITVDSFLVDDDELVELQESGLIPSHYCADCSSRNIADYEIISHSLGVADLKYLFKKFIPNLEGKTVVDVGSRLGAVLYGGYCFSDAQNLVGVEFNSFFCTLQQRTIDKFKLGDRISVIHDDIRNMSDLLQNQADLIVLNNVFEFFMDKKDMEGIWNFLRQSITRPGVMILSSPPLKKVLSRSKVKMTDINCWVKLVKKTKADTCGSIFALYEVL